jgi:hypothetical protein
MKQSIADCSDAFVLLEPFVWLFQKKTLPLNMINAQEDSEQCGRFMLEKHNCVQWDAV